MAKNTTKSAEAIDYYNRGVHSFLGAEPGVETFFQSAIDADPKLALAHVGAREMQLRGRHQMRQRNHCILP